MWIKRQMVMLPSKNGNSKIGLNPKAMFNKPHLYYFNGGAVYHECQHLYFLSDEKPKEGDWMLLNNKVVKCMGTVNNKPKHLSDWQKESSLLKIIATTDTSLGLPQIPQQFIEKWINEYNKGNQIEEVEVGYTHELSCDEDEYGNLIPDIYLKVNSDNTINIKPIKDSWTREEVIELLHKSLNANVVFNDKFNEIFHKQLDKWIEENL